MPLNEAFKEFSIEGKAALVIGAELPLGAAAAQALAEAGANLVLASQDPGTGDPLKELAKKIGAMGRKAVVQIQSAVSRADLSACMDLTVNVDMRDLLQTQAAKVGSAEAERMVRAILQTREAIEQNVNTRVALEVLMLDVPKI